MIKTGIFGGAFNPPHEGHIAIAKEAANNLNLRKLLIIPSFESPHKSTKLMPFDDRAEMCRRAFEGVTYHCGCTVEVSDIERRMGGVSYTINTIRELKRTRPGEEFYLIIGSDMLFSFRDWFKYESILKECKVVAVPREGDDMSEMMEFASEIGRIKIMPAVIPGVSSTEIRERLKNGEPVEGLVSDKVSEYISEKGLYKD